MGVSKNRDTPTMDGFIMENPLRMDDLGGKTTPIFGNTCRFGRKPFEVGCFTVVKVSPWTRRRFGIMEGTPLDAWDFIFRRFFENIWGDLPWNICKNSFYSILAVWLIGPHFVLGYFRSVKYCSLEEIVITALQASWKLYAVRIDEDKGVIPAIPNMNFHIAIQPHCHPKHWHIICMT